MRLTFFENSFGEKGKTLHTKVKTEKEKDIVSSIEEKVEDTFKKRLDELGVRHYGKTESISREIDMALKEASSKSGGSGGNYPDIRCLLDDGQGRRVPVMMECKGAKGKLEKYRKTEISDSVSDVKGYAVNGAVHYGEAILSAGASAEVLVVGMNGSEILPDGSVRDPECKGYYISVKNGMRPKHVPELDNDLTLLSHENTQKLYRIFDNLALTDEEREEIALRLESDLEGKIKAIHQRLYDDAELKTLLGTNDKLYLFCGLIMAGLPVEGVAPLSPDELHSNSNEKLNDGSKITDHIRAFLNGKRCTPEKIEMILNLLDPVFKKKALWQPKSGGESIIKELYRDVQRNIIPSLNSNVRLDFTGKILNSLNDWVSIENDALNDVVLTPRYVTAFMARLCRTDMDSFVWDRAMGSAGFLVSALDIMIKDAESRIKDEKELKEKIQHIKEQQLLGIEILGNIYILAVLNMILMGDGSSNIINDNSHSLDANGNLSYSSDFPATVFLLNPPYSAPGKGFNFVEETLKCMTTGYAAILIQENAGAGQGGTYTRDILKHSTLIASIHMPDKLFSGKASVQTAIYVFRVARPHEKDDLVKFIDFSNDGYSRQNRKKSTQEVNLRDTDHAKERYAEVDPACDTGSFLINR